SVQQQPIRAAAESLSKEDVAKVAEQVLSQTLLNTQPVNALGIKTQKNRVNVRLEDVVRGKNAIYVRYQVTNLSTVPYRVIAPNVSVLAAEGASMPPANQQLGAGYLERLGKVSSTPIDLLHSEIDSRMVRRARPRPGCWPSTAQTARRRSISSFSAPTTRLRSSRRRCCDGHRRGRHARFRDCEERAAGDVSRPGRTRLPAVAAGSGKRPGPARGPGKAAAAPPPAGHAGCRRGDRVRGICLLHPHVTVKLGRTEPFPNTWRF